VLTDKDIETLYKIKCSKYKEEELTVDFKSKLYLEAIREAALMNGISNSNGDNASE
jgi:hypothetical protein